MSHSQSFVFARVVLLPVALVLASVAGLGSYYESNDDASLAWLFSGVLAAGPVPSLPLYLHGYGHALAAAYAAVPGVSWFGGLLGGLLLAGTVLAFAVLDRLLRPHLRPIWLALALTGFFGMAWIEHWLWFSHVRVVLLLAGFSVLFAAQRPGRRWPLALGLAGLGAAWLVRPGVALLGAGAVLPAAVLLAGGWRRAAPAVVGAALALALASGAATVLQTPGAAHAQARNDCFARVLDSEQLQARPRTSADSLGTAALSLWLMGDAAVVSEALCQRAYAFDGPAFWGRVVPAKLLLRAGLLVRDYFPMLLLLVVTALAVGRRPRSAWFWLVQAGFVAGLALLAGVLKLPPRLELPLLDFWLFTNLAFLVKKTEAIRLVQPGLAANHQFEPPFSLGLRRLVVGLAVAAPLLYSAKTLHRRQVLGQERRRHEQALAEISRRTAGRVRVLAGANDLLKSLSPFRVYTLGPGPVLMLSGWPSHDPSQAVLRVHLTGAADQHTCLQRLAEPTRDVQWLLTPETARWLNRRFQHPAGPGPRVTLGPAAALAADASLRFYRPVTP